MYEWYEVLTSRLEEMGMFKNTARLARSVPIVEPFSNQHCVAICINYARALIEVGDIDAGYAMFKRLSEDSSIAKTSEMADRLEYLHLLYAAKAKNRKLEQSILDTMLQQLQNKHAKFSVLSDFFGSIFAADYNVLETIEKQVKPGKVANSRGLADGLTGYSHSLRIRGLWDQSLAAYRFAHKLYECDPSFCGGNVTAYVGESNCLQAQHHMKESAACFEEAEKYMQSRGHVSVTENPEMILQHGDLLREMGQYDAAISLHEGALKTFITRRKELPLRFAGAVLELFLDYKKANKTAEAKNLLTTYLPLIKQGGRETLAEVQQIEQQSAYLGKF
jgi:tetratricopeptide (TPR) repeat protein